MKRRKKLKVTVYNYFHIRKVFPLTWKPCYKCENEFKMEFGYVGYVRPLLEKEPIYCCKDCYVDFNAFDAHLDSLHKKRIGLPPKEE